MKISGRTSPHATDIDRNRMVWDQKPLLREVYRDFYRSIERRLRRDVPGPIVEIGSGIGAIQEVIPECLVTDMVEKSPGRIENMYGLSFANESISNLILLDVFHHLRFPAAALDEALRVLVPGGRLILFEPCVSLLGLLVYGLLHPEPLGIRHSIDLSAPSPEDPRLYSYYAAQANASRIFMGSRYQDLLRKWTVVERTRFSAITYVLSGGYRRVRFYPLCMLGFIRKLDRVADRLPAVFATRILIVLGKAATPQPAMTSPQ